MSDAGDDRERRDRAEQARQRHRLVEAGHPAADVVADRRAEEPDAHHRGRRCAPARAWSSRSSRPGSGTARPRCGADRSGASQPGLTRAPASRRAGRRDRGRRSPDRPAAGRRRTSPGARVCSVPAEAQPQPREDRREDDDEERVQRLEPAARKARAEHDRSACCGRRRGSASSRPARRPTRRARQPRKNTKMITGVRVRRASSCLTRNSQREEARP